MDKPPNGVYQKNNDNFSMLKCFIKSNDDIRGVYNV